MEIYQFFSHYYSDFRNVTVIEDKGFTILIKSLHSKEKCFSYFVHKFKIFSFEFLILCTESREKTITVSRLNYNNGSQPFRCHESVNYLLSRTCPL
jgi:hypothetical protein